MNAPTTTDGLTIPRSDMYCVDPRLTQLSHTRSTNWTYGQLEVCLEVPNLGHAVNLYTALFDAAPTAAERHIVWIDVPDSPVRLGLREVPTPTARRLRLCTDPRRLEVLADRLRRAGMVIAQTGPTPEGTPRSLTFQDPGHNSWELYTPIDTSPPPRATARATSKWWRNLAQHARTALADTVALETRFDHEHQRHQAPRRPRH
jgi:hypothetical protein